MLLLAGCSSTNQIAALKPEPDDASPLVYENSTSFISLPIKIKLQDIESQTNKFLNGVIYEDSNIEDDDIQMKVWKLAPIKISEENGKIKTVLPLKITVNYRYGINKLGIKLYDTREINMNGVLTLLSDVGLTNWKMKTDTSIKSLEWNESPTIKIAGKEVMITYLINPAVRIFKSKIENTLDESIKKSMDFKPNVLDALEKICTPFQMNEAYDSWLRIVPVELYTTEAKLQKNQISLEMGLKCNMETIVGHQPENKFDKNKIVLKPVKTMPEKSNCKYCCSFNISRCFKNYDQKLSRPRIRFRKQKSESSKGGYLAKKQQNDYRFRIARKPQWNNLSFRFSTIQ